MMVAQLILWKRKLNSLDKVKNIRRLQKKTKIQCESISSFSLVRFHFFKFLGQNLSFVLVFLSRLLRIIDFLLQVHNLLGELSLNVFQFLLDLPQTGLQLIFLLRLSLVNSSQLI
jgi:hypothetical protein